MMKYAMMLILAGAASIAAAQDEDVSGSVQMQPIVWEPIITQFFAADVGGNHTVAKHSFAKPDGTPLPDDPGGDMQQWLMLKPLITPRSADFAPREPVLTGWDRLTNESGELEWRYYAHDDYGELAEPLPVRAPLSAGASSDQGILVVAPKDGLIHVHFDLDVMMNQTFKNKEIMLAGNTFKLSSLVVTAHKISDDPLKIRLAPGGDAPVTLLSVGDTSSADGDTFPLVAHTWNAPGNKLTWTVPAPAAGGTVWELRMNARVTGTPGAHDDAVTKSVAGAIRIIVCPDATLQSSPQSYTALRDGKRYGGGP